MKINENVILNMVTRHIVDNTLTRDAFDSLFAMLSRDEQNRVIDFLADQGITLVEEDADAVRPCDTGFTVDGSVFGGNDPVLFTSSLKQGGSRMNELLARAAQAGNEEAQERLFRDNDRLIWDVVRKYTGLYGNCLSDEDLFQAGRLGMLKAVKRFNYDLGYKFSTYALWWIRQAVLREVENNGRTIRVPVHKQEKVRRVMRVYNDLYHQSVPTLQRINAVMKALEETGHPMTEDQIIECIQLHEYVIGCTSLDMPVGEDGDSVLGDFVPADRKDNPEVLLEQICLKSDINEVLRTLTPREENILRLRFGLDDGCERTLEEVGKMFGITRERIRQIEAKALRKLRHPSRSRKLKDWLEAA